MLKVCYAFYMQDFSIRPSSARVLRIGWVLIGVFVGLILLPFLAGFFSFREVSNSISLVLYLLFLGGFGYATVQIVIRSLFAHLSIQENVMIFSSPGKQKRVNINTVIDIDFQIVGRFRFNAGQTTVFLLRPDATAVDCWDIGIGWSNEDLAQLVERVRIQLRQRGITTFPLLESGLYGSSRVKGV